MTPVTTSTIVRNHRQIESAVYDDGQPPWRAETRGRSRRAPNVIDSSGGAAGLDSFGAEAGTPEDLSSRLLDERLLGTAADSASRPPSMLTSVPVM